MEDNVQRYVFFVVVPVVVVVAVVVFACADAVAIAVAVCRLLTKPAWWQECDLSLLFNQV